MSPQVFISYSRQDSAWANALAQDLAQRGVRVWIDQSSIPASVPWRDEIRHAVRGSVVMVVVDSPAHRSSRSCQDEVAVARAVSKPIVAVHPGMTPSAGGSVLAAVAQLRPDDLAGAELLARASRWTADSRPRHALARGRGLRAYRRVARRPALRDDESVAAFMRASRRWRSRQRAVVAALVLLFAILAVLPRLFEAGVDQTVAGFEERQARAQEFTNAYTATVADPREGLPIALALLEAPEATDAMSFQEADLSSRLLGLHLPRPASQIPSGVLRAQLVARAAEGGWTARTGSDRRTVTISKDGEIRVRITRASRVTALAWDPAGPNLAVADAEGIGVYDPDAGTRWSELLDSGGTRKLGYVRPGEVAAQTADGRHVTWQTRTGSVLARDQEWWFMDAATSSDGRVGAVSRNGHVVEVDASGAEVIEVGEIRDGQGLSITASPDGWLVGATSRNQGSIWAMPFGGGEASEIPAPDCTPRDLTWHPEVDLAIACMVPQYGTWSPGQPEVVMHETALVGVEAVATLGEDLVLAGGPSEFQLSRNGSSTPELLRFGKETCWGGARVLATAPTARFVFSGGAGLDSGCFERLTVAGDGVVTDLPPLTDAGNETRALATTRSGDLLAVGTSTGAVWVFSSDELDVLQVSQVSGREVRGLAFAKGDSVLIVATRGGEVIRLPVAAHVPLDQRVDSLRASLEAMPLRQRR